MLALTVNFTFEDAKKKRSTTKIRLESSVSIANAVAWAEAAAQIMKDMSSARLVEVSVSVGLDLSAVSLKSVATQFSDVFEKGMFVLKSAANGLFGRLNLPTWDEANNFANSDQIDPADAQVAALITILEDGVTNAGTTTNAITSRGEVVTDVLSMRNIFRKS